MNTITTDPTEALMEQFDRGGSVPMPFAKAFMTALGDKSYFFSAINQEVSFPEDRFVTTHDGATYLNMRDGQTPHFIDALVQRPDLTAGKPARPACDERTKLFRSAPAADRQGR